MKNQTNADASKSKKLIICLAVLFAIIFVAVAISILAIGWQSVKMAKDANDVYTAAFESLTKQSADAKAAYDKAAQSYTDATAVYASTDEEYQKCLVQLALAKEDYAEALSSLSLAEDKTEQNLDEASEALDNAKSALTAAEAKLLEAQNKYSEAKQSYKNAEDAYNAALELHNAPQTASDNAVYEECVDAVVELHCYLADGTYFAMGSGFFISEDGRLVTNYHVIDESYKITVSVNNESEEYEVTKVLGYDKDVDLAIVQIDRDGCDYLELSGEDVTVGDTVYAIGSSLGFTRSFTKGVVSYVDREIEDFDGCMYIQYAGLTNSGSSGCPLVNANGKVIGINRLGAEEGIEGFAIPAEEVDKIELDKNETVIDVLSNNAFDLTDSLTYSIRNDEVTITGIKSVVENSAVAIPAEINGKPVTKLDWGGFSSNLYYVLTLVIPENVEILGSDLFNGASNLSLLFLPSTLTSAEADSFYAPLLYKILLADGCQGFKVEDDVLYNADKTVLYKYSLCKDDEDGDCFVTSFAMPSTVTEVGDYAFFHAVKLEQLVASSALRTVGKLSFAYCTALEDLRLNSGLEALGIGAFAYDSALQSITIPASAARFGAEYGGEDGTMYVGAFYACTSLKTVTFESGSQAESLGDALFAACSALTRINNLPASVTDVGNGVFFNCSALQGADLSSWNVTSIGDAAFKNCSALLTVTLPTALEKISYACFQNCRLLHSVSIPEGVIAIEDYAFYDTAITNISVSDEFKSLGEYAFYSCDMLASTNFAGTKLSAVGAYAFYECAALRNVEFGGDLKVIGDSAYYGCDELSTVCLSAGLTVIGVDAFADCGNLYLVDATACTYAPYLRDCGVFDGAADDMQIALSDINQYYFYFDSAWTVYAESFYIG